ncbi:phage tail tube protein [Methanosphaera cuniculi]|uniref:Uncharacterized protein n=1 Tax=Methanosphaera cuniculi TaxID=1077256 RepID=A0A2A2HE85_9EURY|nr:phage tail tube protein [Methanosphaera cuniculi]PAV07638.1 hypothetical protein ASJ82_08150 [Methanosphaera cuniculi]PWL08037.1 hypothetical protein MSCUN_09680 [Methanosphaera cuniculi]
MTQVVSFSPEQKWANEAEDDDTHIRADKANASLNAEPVTLNGGSKTIQKMRVGYPEPSSEMDTAIDTKVFHKYMYYTLGNYAHSTTTVNGQSKHCHEFYGGDSTKLPSATTRLTYDVDDYVLEKTLLGCVMDEFNLETSDELSTASLSMIYRTEKSKKISQTEQDIREVDAVPFIGYDYQITLGGVDSYVFNELKLSIKNNHKIDGARGLGNRFYGRQPNVGEREIQLELTTVFDTDNLETVIKSEYGDENLETITDENGYWIPSKCKLFTIPLKLKIMTCEDATEYVEIEILNCIISIDPLEFSGSDDVEVKLTLQATGTKKVALNSGVEKRTDIRCIVVNDQEEITPSIKTATTTPSSTYTSTEEE